MSLYDEVITSVKEERITTDFYRFQGANSFDYFDIKNSTFLNDSRNSYVYLSHSIDHHKYFTLKRIRQLLNSMVLQEEGLQVSCKYLRDNNSYSNIQHLILNSDKLQSLYSVRLICDRNAIMLMKENSFYQYEKDKGRPIERVDRKVYGGGFGVAAEWTTLLECLTYFNGYHRIDKNSIITLLSNMRKTGKVTCKDNISFIFSNPAYYRFELSPKLESDFTKYDIMESLEQICENGTYSPTSSLGENPSKTIKQVVEDYEQGREKVLTLLDKHYKNTIKE